MSTSISPPAASVVVPFRDAAATLPECLDSIRAQSFGQFEVLAIDDGSTDDSAAIVRGFARKDSRVRLIRPGRIGLVAALNLGLQQARAPLVARMDADDRMHPERIGAQVRFLERHPQVAVLGTQVRAFPEWSVRAGWREYVRWQNRCITPEQIACELYVESPLAHPTVMFQRRAVLEAGGYACGDFPEDYELWLRLHHRGLKMTKLPRVLLDWRDGARRASRTDSRYRREAFDRLRARYLAQDARLPEEGSLVFWGAGRKTRARARHLIERGFPPRAWIDIDPRKIGNRIWGAWVHGPDWLNHTPPPFLLSYVTNHGAREDIAARLGALGYTPGKHYLMVG